jgi:hypothetical protein
MATGLPSVMDGADIPRGPEPPANHWLIYYGDLAKLSTVGYKWMW